MTTDEVMAEARSRGLTLFLKADGSLGLRGQESELTPPLRRVLKLHERRICRKLAEAILAEIGDDLPAWVTAAPAPRPSVAAEQTPPALPAPVEEEAEPEPEWKPVPAGWP